MMHTMGLVLPAWRAAISSLIQPKTAARPSTSSPFTSMWSSMARIRLWQG